MGALEFTSCAWTGALSADWNTAGNWSTGVVPSAGIDVSIPDVANDPVINEATTSPASCRDLTIASGAVLTINAGKALTANGNTTNDGAFYILADANGSGSFISIGNIGGTGNFKIRRWVSTNGSSRWEYVSSPVAAASSSLFTSPTRGLWYANEPTNSWVSIPNASPAGLIVMKGYTRKYVQAEGDGNTYVEFSGQPNSGTYSIGLSRTESAPGAQHGWNLTGNPYPSTMDWDASAGWTKTNVNNGIYFRTNGNYASYVGGIGTNGGTRYIPPMQAFWVRVSAGQSVGLLGSNNSVRVHNSHNIYKASGMVNTLSLMITNQSNALTDETVIRFGAYATDTFDGNYDAYKMFAADTIYPQVYTNVQGADLSINSMSELLSATHIPLGFMTRLSGQYSLTADYVNSFTDIGNFVYLEDLVTGAYQNLGTNDTYTFSSGPSGGLNRFLLHFIPGTVNTGNVMPTDDAVNIYSCENSVYVTGSGLLQGQVEVYDMLGRQIFSRKVSGEKIIRVNIKANPAVYIVKFVGETFMVTERVFLKQ